MHDVSELIAVLANPRRLVEQMRVPVSRKTLPGMMGESVSQHVFGRYEHVLVRMRL